MNVNDIIEVQWTCGSIDEARKIVRFLVQKRLAASAQIIPWFESVYMWDNRLEVSQESKVIIKSRFGCFEKIQNTILQNSSYQLPEITFTSIKGGNIQFLEWVIDSTPDFSDESSLTSD